LSGVNGSRSWSNCRSGQYDLGHGLTQAIVEARETPDFEASLAIDTADHDHAEAVLRLSLWNSEILSC
jgi:hypothetical protein